MRFRVAAVVTFAISAIVCACSIFHSLDDLTNGAGDRLDRPDGSAGDATVDGDPTPVCPPGIDFAADSANCGRCAHDCLGGGCNMGVCQPRVMTSAATAPVDLLVVNDTLWIVTDDTILAQPLVGGLAQGPQTTLAAGQAGIHRLATDGTYLYWTRYAAGLVLRCALAGCGQTPEVIATGQRSPFDVAYDPVSHRIVWANHALDENCDDAGPTTHGDVRTALLDGGDQQILVADAGTYPSNVGANGYAIYYTLDHCTGNQPDNATIRNVTSAGISTLENEGQGYNVLGFAVDDAGTATAVKYNDIIVTPIGAGGPNRRFKTESPQRVALDPTRVYWTAKLSTPVDGYSSFVHFKLRSEPSGDGGTTTYPFDGGSPVNGIALGPKAIYFTKFNNILVVAKP